MITYATKKARLMDKKVPDDRVEDVPGWRTAKLKTSELMKPPMKKMPRNSAGGKVFFITLRGLSGYFCLVGL